MVPSKIDIRCCFGLNVQRCYERMNAGTWRLYSINSICIINGIYVVFISHKAPCE